LHIKAKHLTQFIYKSLTNYSIDFIVWLIGDKKKYEKKVIGLTLQLITILSFM